jgi:hypothetical protein
MPHVSCTTQPSVYDSKYFASRYKKRHALKKVFDYFTGVTDEQIPFMQGVNRTSWNNLVRRHKLNEIERKMPQFLVLGGDIQLIVVEDCQDIHYKRKKKRREKKGIRPHDLETFEFFFDVGEIMKSWTISSVLVSHQENQGDNQMHILNKVKNSLVATPFNPVTQEPFNPSEMKFFRKVFKKREKQFFKREEKYTQDEQLYNNSNLAGFAVMGANVAIQYTGYESLMEFTKHLGNTVWALNAGAFVKKTNISNLGATSIISTLITNDKKKFTVINFQDKIKKTLHLLSHRDSSGYNVLIHKIYKLWGMELVLERLAEQNELTMAFQTLETFLTTLQAIVVFVPFANIGVQALETFLSIIQTSFIGQYAKVPGLFLTFMSILYGKIIPRIATHIEKYNDIAELKQSPNTRLDNFHPGLSTTLYLKNQILHQVWDYVIPELKNEEHVDNKIRDYFEILMVDYINAKIIPMYTTSVKRKKLHKSSNWKMLSLLKTLDGNNSITFLPANSNLCVSQCQDGGVCMNTRRGKLNVCGLHDL